MANKWRTTVTEANAVFSKYSVNPVESVSDVLIREWTGIDRSVLQTLIATLRTTISVVDPLADNLKYDGAWSVISVEESKETAGNLSGSATIVQSLNLLRTSISDSHWKKESYSDDPVSPTSKMLVRVVYGINRANSQSILNTLNSAETVVDPYADGIVYPGTWRIAKNESQPISDGSMAGSDMITQTLGKYYTTIADSQWVKESYRNDTQNPFAKILVRAVYGIDRSYTNTLINSFGSTFVGSPYADGIVYSGNYRIIKVEARPINDGSLNGSDVIIQTLGEGYFSTLSSSNLIIAKKTYGTEDQNENAWMYYETPTITETSRWVSISAGSIANLFPYTTNVFFSTGVLAGYSTPIILENWYEKEEDGSYSMYRTLFARSTTGKTVKYRDLQYAGMILTNAIVPPMEDDATIYMSGFRKADETIYADAKFSIAGDTYRVLQTVAASGGNVTVSVSPKVTLSTETACDTLDGSAQQVYFESLT